MAEHRRRFADQPVHSATVERQVPSCSGQLTEEPANVRYGRPPTFAGQIPATATSLFPSFGQSARMTSLAGSSCSVGLALDVFMLANSVIKSSRWRQSPVACIRTRYFGQENRAERGRCTWSKQMTLPSPVQSLQEPHFQIGQIRACTHGRPRLCVAIVLVRLLVSAVAALAIHVRPERGLARVSRPDRRLEVFV